MTYNVPITAGSGTTIGADDVTDGALGTVKVQYVKLMDGTLAGTDKAAVGADGLVVDVSASTGIGSLTETAPSTDTASSGLNGRLQRIAQRLTTILTGLVLAAGENHIGQVGGHQTTASTDVTRPNDTTAYAANDAWADSTSSPTAGGFTLTGVARASGGSGIVTDIIVTSSNAPGTALQGELWVFDQAVTALNDNAAFSVSDADIKNLVAVVPFLLTLDANNSWAHVQGLNIGFTCVGSANLRYLIKVKNAYTPAANEVLTVRAKAVQTT